MNAKNNLKICSNPNCSHGRNFQPISNFYKDSSQPDKLCKYCKNCKKIMDKNRYNKNKDHLKNLAKINYYKNKNHKLEVKNKRERQLVKYNYGYSKLNKYEKCRKDPRNLNLLQVKCRYCGKWTNITYLQLDNRLKSINCDPSEPKGNSYFYCSESCKKACPSFKKQKYLRGYEPAPSREVQPELRKLVLERDNWTCQKCGKSKEEYPELELHCHHIFPLNEDPAGSADIDNCITLCKECHQKIHKEVAGCKYNELKCSN